jgi:hypothetical protein
VWIGLPYRSRPSVGPELVCTESDVSCDLGHCACFAGEEPEAQSWAAWGCAILCGGDGGADIHPSAQCAEPCFTKRSLSAFLSLWGVWPQGHPFFFFF